MAGAPERQQPRHVPQARRQGHHRGDLTIANASPNNDGAVRWRTYTGGNPDAWALLQDDGNFVVYKKTGGPGKGGALWNSGTYNKI
ncbi:hypothetical protein [Streptomyces sp. NPDC058701]|uniref:hypothetical protein n=1 Tax=Streptomyces sp. NPDC058701 TaxID=3346608 RepID=UPI003646B183